MNSLEQKYQFLKSNADASKDSYKFIIQDTLVSHFKGYDKILTIDMCDQETLLRDFNGGFPVIGNFYTFVHFSKIPIVINNTQIIDIIPVFLCLKVHGTKIYGFNFNLIPNKYRWGTILEILKSNKSLYNNLEDYIKNNELVINEKLASIVQSNGVKWLLEYINKKIGYNISLSYRIYDIKDMFDLRLIEIPLWPYIPFLDSTNLFRMSKVTMN